MKNIPSVLYLVDGDNCLYDGLNGIEDLPSKSRVFVFACDRALLSKVGRKYKGMAELIFVEPGNQAVDRRIIGYIGSVLPRCTDERIVVISRDHGYTPYIVSAN